MKLRLLAVLLVAVIVQQTRACASSQCAGASTKRVVNKTVERVEVSDVEQAQWRGACHSLCITVS